MEQSNHNLDKLVAAAEVAVVEEVSNDVTEIIKKSRSVCLNRSCNKIGYYMESPTIVSLFNLF
jgi:hypothetical protein